MLGTCLLSKYIMILFNHLNQCISYRQIAWFTPFSVLGTIGCLVYNSGLVSLVITCYLAQNPSKIFNI